MSSGYVNVKRALILQRIAAAWDKSPHLRLGHLLVMAAYSEHIEAEGALERMEDERLAGLVERYVVMRSTPPPEFEEDEPATERRCRVCGEAERGHDDGKLHKFATAPRMPAVKT